MSLENNIKDVISGKLEDGTDLDIYCGKCWLGI